MTPEEIEILRKAILKYLVDRRPAAFAVAGITGGLRGRSLVDFPITEPEVARELAFLHDLGDVEFTHEHVGSTKYWHANAKGVLAVERGGRG